MSLALTSRRAALLPGRWVSNELWRRARAVPSLDLRFAENKSLVDSVSGQSLITFTRASTGTYIDSDGVIRSAANDAPRFDHNPLTGECLGLLVEEQRTNLLLQSEDFSTTWSYISSSATVNVATAPDGTLSADKLIPDNGSTLAQSGLLQDKAKIASPVTYTFSAYCKAAEFDTVRILFTDPAPGVLGRVFADYNLLDGSEITAPSTAGTFSAGSGGIVDTGNGWYRVFVTALTSTETSLRVRLYARDSSATTGDGTSGIYIWGAQLEEGAFPTSYIKTEAADATRTADVASITTAGGNVRSLFTSFRSPASGTRPVVSLDDNTANERIEILTSGTDPKLLVTDGGSAVADLNGGTVTANVLARIAARFNTDDYAVSINGGTSQLDAAGTLPAVDRIRIGSNQAGGCLSGPIARVTAWDSTLPLLPSISQ